LLDELAPPLDPFVFLTNVLDLTGVPWGEGDQDEFTVVLTLLLLLFAAVVVVVVTGDAPFFG
jgi:hypothetical protein